MQLERNSVPFGVLRSQHPRREKLQDPILLAQCLPLIGNYLNIVKHAAADAVYLSLTADDDQVVLKVRDNGRGNQAEPEQSSSGIGLCSMQERAELTGGQLFVVTRDGGGLSIIGRWDRGEPR
jgi:NarL family two-component system sensor histidine kinase YdfH